MYTYIYIYIYIYIVYMYIYIYIYIMYIHIHIHTCYMYVYIYIYTHIYLSIYRTPGVQGEGLGGLRDGRLAAVVRLHEELILSHRPAKVTKCRDLAPMESTLRDGTRDNNAAELASRFRKGDIMALVCNPQGSWRRWHHRIIDLSSSQMNTRGCNI